MQHERRFSGGTDAALAALRSYWECFHESGTIAAGVRPEIAASWQRSAERQLTSELPAVPLDELALQGFDHAGQARKQFLSSARRLADHLAGELQDTNSGVIVCDDLGVLLYRTGSRDILRRTDRLNLVPGGLWSEREAGTNGIGLALELGGLAHVSSAEHYVGAFHDFSCTAATVRHPVTREVLGVLDLTTDTRASGSLAPPLVARAARDIERLLEEQVFGRERELLEHYLRGRSGRQDPFLTVDRAGHTIIQNARMLQTASAEDVQLLLGIARRALGAEADSSEQVQLSRGPSLVAVRLVRTGPEVVGALVSLERMARARPDRGATPVEDWSPIVGRSPAMQRLVGHASKIARERLPVMICGEPGTGKLTLATVLHRVAGDIGPFSIVHCARTSWREEWQDAVTRGGTVVLSRVHALDDDAQLELADEIDTQGGEGPWLISLFNSDAKPPVSELRFRLARVSLAVPALRDRGHDVRLLVDAWCDARQRDHGARPSVRQEAQEALAAQDWPGNVRELHNVLEGALLRSGSVIGVETLDLDTTGRRSARRAAGSLQDIERDAIVGALARNGGNVTRTAKELGIGRATLHRRLRAYRLLGTDPDGH
jgi:transcriptional regulator of acetoin/glycerol metabolism